MGATRRDFLKGAAGITVVGLAAGTSLLKASSERTPVGKPTSGPGPTPLPPPAAPVETVPAPRRWAFYVDTDKCAREPDCKLCTQACHGLHNVPDLGNAKEEVKWLWREPREAVLPEVVNERTAEPLRKVPVLVLCNHCDNPPCVRVCPTKATWKREDGVVMMDPHRCIGCRYCMVACPYGSRSFNWRDPRPALAKVNEDYPTRTKGVVEKCTLCDERLAKGERPACVEACKAKALVFGDLEDRSSKIYSLVTSNCLLRRKANLGTRPQVYYKV